MTLRILLWCLLIYFAFRFVVNFLIPVIKVSRQMKRQVKEFQQHAQQFNQQQGFQEEPPKVQKTPAQPAPKKDDYIDFEEV